MFSCDNKLYLTNTFAYNFYLINSNIVLNMWKRVENKQA